MKYTIELTDNQKKQMDLLCELAHRYIGFNPKLEPIKTTNVEDTNEYEIGYKTGYDKGYYDGYDKCLHSSANDDYEKGKLDGLEEFENLFINEYDYEQFFEDTYGIFEDTYGTKDPDYNLYDLVARYGAKKVVDDFKKWQEEKKEAEIKVGDEVISLSSGIKAVVTMVDDETVFVVYSDGSCGDFDKENFKKTGRTIKEVIQSLDELRGVKSEE